MSERKKVPIGALDEPDALDAILGRIMPKTLTVQEVVKGAKQKKRDTYKWNCLLMVIDWHGLKPSDKLQIGGLEEQLGRMSKDEIERRIEQLESDRAEVCAVEGTGKAAHDS